MVDFNTKAPTGPLSNLYSSKYNFNSLHFPNDLGQPNRGHWVNFYFNVSENSQYIENKTFSYPNPSGSPTSYSVLNSSGVATTLLSNAKNNLFFNDINPKSVTSGINNFINSNAGSSVLPDNFNLGLGRQTKRISQAIALYMPDSIKFDYSIQYDVQSATDAFGIWGFGVQAGAGVYAQSQNGQGIRKNVSQSAYTIEAAGTILEKSGTIGQGGKQFLMNKSGFAINDQLAVLFKGVGFREFEFAFTFVPKNEIEAENVENIINTFKFHAHPEIGSNDISSLGRYWSGMSDVDIDIIHNGEINPHLPKISTCVITNINIDPSPHGWSAYKDGQPTIRTLVLRMRETQILTRNSIAQNGF